MQEMQEMLPNSYATNEAASTSYKMAHFTKAARDPTIMLDLQKITKIAQRVQQPSASSLLCYLLHNQNITTPTWKLTLIKVLLATPQTLFECSSSTTNVVFLLQDSVLDLTLNLVLKSLQPPLTCDDSSVSVFQDLDICKEN